MTAAPADFVDLYRAELAYVVRTLRRLGVAERDVEDVAHDVFLVVFRRREDRDPARPIRPWLFGIAYRVVGNHFQKAHRRREVSDETPESADGAPTPAEDAEQHERRRILLRALDDLDHEHRAVAILYEIEGLPAPVIAETLAIPVNTVYSRARSARQRLLEATRQLRGEKP